MGRRLSLIGVVFAAALAGVASALAGPPASWSYGPDMNAPRVAFVSVPLSNGKIVAIGGTYNAPAATASADVLDAGAGGWLPTGPMSVARRYFAGVRLAGDRVLVAGGAGDGSNAALASAEVWDPDTAAFTATSPMGVVRQSLSLTALPDGRALAAGGAPAFPNGPQTATAELYDPGTNSWSPTGSMHAARLGHTGTLLPDCRVLVVGDNPTAELYNYKTGAFSTSGSEPFQRSYHTATLLADGRVLIAGGVDAGNNALASAAVFDPATGQFTQAGTMSESRTEAMAVRLADGRVLVAGGLTGAAQAPTKTADIYDPATNAWTAGPDMREVAATGQAQLLPDGRAVVIGGDFSGGKKTQIFDPASTAGPAQSPPAPDCSSLPGPTPAPAPTPSTGDTSVGDGTGAPPPSQPVAATPAETILVKHPKKIVTTRTTKARVTFTFRSPTPGATFICKLDKAKPTTCKSPARYRVKPGKHTFVVTAKGPGGSDPTPARFRFTVKRKR